MTQFYLFGANVSVKKENTSGIYLLPNLFTTASLFAAFYSMVATFTMRFETAVIAIFVGMIADGLDGRIARLTNTQSEFGAQYDSLSDMATFGTAPALLLYGYSLKTLGKFGWLVAFMYVAAVALRLARFNVQHETADNRYFLGLPCPPAAAVVSSLIWVCVENQWSHPVMTWIIAAVSLGLSLLMVSNLRYCSFKEVDFKGRVPFLYLLLMVVIFVAVAANPASVLMGAFALFALSGPAMSLWYLGRRRQSKKKKS